MFLIRSPWVKAFLNAARQNACIGCEHPYTQTAGNENIRRNGKTRLFIGFSNKTSRNVSVRA